MINDVKIVVRHELHIYHALARLAAASDGSSYSESIIIAVVSDRAINFYSNFHFQCLCL